MKIVQINAVYGTGSTGRTTQELHRALLRHGHESWAFCSDIACLEENVLPVGTAFDHKRHAFFSRLWGLQGYFSSRSTGQLIDRLTAIGPDIVHLRNLHANFIDLPRLLDFLARKDIPTVLTLHDCWFFTGHCCHYTEDGCTKWETGCHDCPALQKYNRSWFFDRSEKVYRDKKRLFGRIPRLAVVGNSEWTAEQARRSLLKNAKIITRIYNWIDLDVFRPLEKTTVRKELKIDSERFVILAAAQGWSEKKGLSVLLEIASRRPEWTVLLLGADDGVSGLPDNVIRAGMVSDARDMARFYSAADAFVNTSLQETFGKVTAEALACGTPVVVNDATANPELVGDGCGYIVRNNDTTEYLHYLHEVQLRGKAFYSDKCLRFAETNFKMENNIGEYIDLYRKLISVR